MTILASRQQTCIHPKVSKLAGKDEACKKLMKGVSETDKESVNNK